MKFITLVMQALFCRGRKQAIAILALSLFGCGVKPKTAPAVGAVSKCGPMPDKQQLCLEVLPVTASDAEIARCMVESIDDLIAENGQLRARYAPCAQ